MKEKTKIRHSRHRVFDLHVHLIFVTRYRRHVFTKVCADFEVELAEFDAEDDLVCLLRKQHPELVRRYRKGALWSPSYFAGASHCLH